MYALDWGNMPTYLGAVYVVGRGKMLDRDLGVVRRRFAFAVLASAINAQLAAPTRHSPAALVEAVHVEPWAVWTNKLGVNALRLNGL